MYRQSYISMCFLFICIVDCIYTIKILLVANIWAYIDYAINVPADKCRLIGPYIPKILVAEKSYNQMKLLWTMVNTVTCTVYIQNMCNTVYLKAKDNHTILFLRCLFIHQYLYLLCKWEFTPMWQDRRFKKKICTQKNPYLVHTNNWWWWKLQIAMLQKFVQCNIMDIIVNTNKKIKQPTFALLSLLYPGCHLHILKTSCRHTFTQIHIQ